MPADLIIHATAEVAQVVEHGTENAGVDSSSLSLGTIINLGLVHRGPVLRPEDLLVYIERKWLSGRAPPCQGGGREFKSRLPLQIFKPIVFSPHLLLFSSRSNKTCCS